MPKGKNVIFLGLFLFFLALSMYAPNYDSMLISIANASPNVQTIFKYSFLVIAMGFLFVGALNNE